MTVTDFPSEADWVMIGRAKFAAYEPPAVVRFLRSGRSVVVIADLLKVSTGQVALELRMAAEAEREANYDRRPLHGKTAVSGMKTVTDEQYAAKRREWRFDRGE